MDIAIQIFLVVIGLPLTIAAIVRTRQLINPASLLFFCFFIPLFFALYRFSGLQANQWQYETYITIIASIGAWLLIPCLIIIIHPAFNSQKPKTGADQYNIDRLQLIVRIFTVIAISAYFASNIIQTKNILPLLDPSRAFEAHAEFPQGLRFFARANPAAAILCYIVYFYKRQKLDLLLLIIALITPISRLSRIDPAIAMTGIAAMYMVLPLFKFNKTRVLTTVTIILALMIGTAELGSQRQNRFGLYEFKYSEMIKWEPKITGPSELFPTLYGYTSLSFENLDASIKAHRGNYTIALYSFDWFYSGFLKLNWFTPYEWVRAMNDRSQIVNTAATVPTALLPFFNDFGPIFIIIPLILYVGIWLALYIKAQRNTMYTALYGMYAGAFALSSFQALIAASIIVHQLAWILLFFYLCKTKNSTQPSMSLLNQSAIAKHSAQIVSS